MCNGTNEESTQKKKVANSQYVEEKQQPVGGGLVYISTDSWVAIAGLNFDQDSIDPVQPIYALPDFIG